MRVEDLSDLNMQKLRLVLKKPKSIALYFQGDPLENLFYIQNVTVPAVSFVKSLDVASLLPIVLNRGYRKAATLLGVSVGFLKKEVYGKVAGVAIPSLERDMFDPVSEAEGLDLIEKCPFIPLLKILTGWKEKRLRSLCKSRLNVDSFLNTSKGRKAELTYISYRERCILEDCNGSGDARSPFDVVDSEYGRVNVKGSKNRPLKDGSGRWYFNLSGGECDYFAVIGYDELFAVPIFMKMVPTSTGGGSLVITEREAKEFLLEI